MASTCAKNSNSISILRNGQPMELCSTNECQNTASCSIGPTGPTGPKGDAGTIDYSIKQDLLPFTDGIISLGIPSKRFKNVYAENVYQKQQIQTVTSSNGVYSVDYNAGTVFYLKDHDATNGPAQLQINNLPINGYHSFKTIVKPINNSSDNYVSAIKVRKNTSDAFTDTTIQFNVDNATLQSMVSGANYILQNHDYCNLDVLRVFSNVSKYT